MSSPYLPLVRVPPAIEVEYETAVPGAMCCETTVQLVFDVEPKDTALLLLVIEVGWFLLRKPDLADASPKMTL